MAGFKFARARPIQCQSEGTAGVGRHEDYECGNTQAGNGHGIEPGQRQGCHNASGDYGQRFEHDGRIDGCIDGRSGNAIEPA